MQFRAVLKQMLGLSDRPIGSTCETYALGVSRFVSESPSIALTSMPVIQKPENGKSSPKKEQTFIFKVPRIREQISEGVETEDVDENFTQV